MAGKIGCLAWFCSRSSGVRDRRTPDYATRQWSPGKVLPLRLLGVGQTRYYFTTGRKLAAGDGFAPSTALSKSAELLVTPSRNELVEPEVVATSPNRIKSPVPVYCGFSSVKLVLAAGFAPALATLSTSCLCWLDYTSKKKWSLPPVLPRHDFFTKEIHRL